jgi:hypothetical protein
MSSSSSTGGIYTRRSFRASPTPSATCAATSSPESLVTDLSGVLGETDGIVQLWFDDMDGFNAFFNSQSYRDVIRPDEERFTDPKRCEFFLSTEHTIME